MLRDDAGMANSDSESNTRLSWRQVYYAFIDWRVYLYTAINIGDLALVKCLLTYLPILVGNMGYSKTEEQLMSTLPYIVACACALLGSYFSSRNNDHGYHLTFFLAVSLLGYVLLATCLQSGIAIMYVGPCLILSGIWTAFPILMSWLTKNVGGHTKRAMAVGLAMGAGQIGGIVAPLVSRQLRKNLRLIFFLFSSKDLP
jgi:cyanate permease